MKPNLLYTLAFDPPGEGGQRQLAKLMVSSVLRTYFTGDVVAFRNTEPPLFQLERKGLDEVLVEADFAPSAAPSTAAEGKGIETTQKATHGALAKGAMDAKFNLRNLLQASAPMPLEEYDKIIFLDADCVVLQNLDSLLEGDWDILYQREKGRTHRDPVFSGYWTEDEMQNLSQDGSNSGTWAVRAERFLDILETWEEIATKAPLRETTWTEQGAWNRLIQDAPRSGLVCREFPMGSVQFPLQMDLDWRKYRKAHILHAVGTDLVGKGEFLFGMFMQRFYWESSGLFFNILEM